LQKKKGSPSKDASKSLEMHDSPKEEPPIISTTEKEPPEKTPTDAEVALAKVIAIRSLSESLSLKPSVPSSIFSLRDLV